LRGANSTGLTKEVALRGLALEGQLSPQIKGFNQDVTDLLLKNGAGGDFQVPGDYLYRTFQSFQFDGGMWGVFRVIP
jgi:hypothetical protein